MSKILKYFALNLAAEIKERGLTNKEFSKLTGVDETQLGRYLLEKRAPRLELLEKLSDELGIPAAQFLESPEERRAREKREEEEIAEQAMKEAGLIKAGSIEAELAEIKGLLRSALATTQRDVGVDEASRKRNPNKSEFLDVLSEMSDAEVKILLALLPRDLIARARAKKKGVGNG